MHAELLTWGTPRLRDLPWRHSRDPWAVLVSEMMLQQTQVARVVRAWSEFVDAFPTPAACAAAPLGDVLRIWHGLGYPRRARNLHAAARLIAAAERFPDTLDGLLGLPGVGPYTARAVLAFAFERDAAVVDTNIARVFARLAGRRLTLSEVQAMADAALPPGEAWLWNQSLMDLGATVCRLLPDCQACPLTRHCRWNGHGADPAVGSAAVSGRQARFQGSDRQGRGRVLAELMHGPLDDSRLADVTGRSAVDAQRLAASLVADGLVIRQGSTYLLP